MADTDTQHMQRALRLAARAAGRTSPNPLVGAVVVKRGVVVGEGYHHRAGEPHAEVNALKEAGAKAKGATVYVTLEPHCFQGRTAPCTDALKAANVARVVVAMRDPDPRIGGKGLRILRAAGIDVTEGILADEAARLNEGYLARITKGRPFVTVKLATTLDGRITAPGRRYLTGKPALREVHRLRDRNDAVLVGIGTVLADDPQLTVREVRGRDPLRVVVDSEARTPVTARIVLASDPQRTIVLVARDAPATRIKRLRATGVVVATLSRAKGGGLNLTDALRWLGERGTNSVLVEAGPQVAGALIRGNLADRLLLYVAPLAGGVGALGLGNAGDIRALRELTVRRVGDDIAVTGYLGL